MRDAGLGIGSGYVRLEDSPSSKVRQDLDQEHSPRQPKLLKFLNILSLSSYLFKN